MGAQAYCVFYKASCNNKFVSYKIVSQNTQKQLNIRIFTRDEGLNPFCDKIQSFIFKNQFLNKIFPTLKFEAQNQHDHT